MLRRRHASSETVNGNLKQNQQVLNSQKWRFRTTLGDGGSHLARVTNPRGYFVRYGGPSCLPMSVSISSEKHYKLVPPDEVTAADVKNYQQRAAD